MPHLLGVARGDESDASEKIEFQVAVLFSGSAASPLPELRGKDLLIYLAELQAEATAATSLRANSTIGSQKNSVRRFAVSNSRDSRDLHEWQRNKVGLSSVGAKFQFCRFPGAKMNYRLGSTSLAYCLISRCLGTTHETPRGISGPLTLSRSDEWMDGQPSRLRRSPRPSDIALVLSSVTSSASSGF